MTTIVLDIDTTLEYMEKAVKFRGPQHVDPRSGNIDGCKYTPSGDLPSCIVGQILQYAGVTTNELRVMDTRGYYGSSFAALMEVRDQVLDGSDYVDEGDDVLPENLTITPGAATLLASAQDAQDYGTQWGVIYSSAVEQAAQIRSGHSDPMKF